jgi:hypothetical protein
MRLTNYDVDSIRQTEEFMLRPDMTIQIQALPPDYDDQVEAELPSPQPERLGVEKDAKGNPILDSENKPIIRYKDDDLEHLKAASRMGKLHAIYLMVEGIVPGQIEFQVQKDPDKREAFYEAILVELREFGFSMGDLLKIVKAISKLSGISAEDIKAAEAGFSQAEN